MVNFWAKMHFGGLNLHTLELKEDRSIGQNPQTGEEMIAKFDVSYYLTTKGEYIEDYAFFAEKKIYVNFKNRMSNSDISKIGAFRIKNETSIYNENNLKIGEGYKDLHSAVMAFFGKDAHGMKANPLAWLGVLLYTISMIVLSFHLMHGFAAAFQTLGLRHARYTPIIKKIGTGFSIIVPALFAIIPLYIFFNK